MTRTISPTENNYRMEKSDQLISLVLSAFKKEVVRKLVFSRPRAGEVKKISGREVAHRGRISISAR